MKKLRIAVLLVTVISLTGLFLACPSESSSNNVTANKTPEGGDYKITPKTVFDFGETVSINVELIAEGSPGAVTMIYFDGAAAVPSAAGTYVVTFDVAAATGWNAGNKLYAGKVTINDKLKTNPTIDNYVVTGLGTFTYTGSAFAVTATPAAGSGAPAAVVKYAESGKAPATAAPSAIGQYAVTLDVAGNDAFNAASIPAGVLRIISSSEGVLRPIAEDFTIGNLNQTAGSVTAVTITAKTAGVQGAVGNIRYDGGTAIPQTAGSYSVTFDVAASGDWLAAAGLYGGQLIVTGGSGGSGVPTLDLFTLSVVSGTGSAATTAPGMGAVYKTGESKAVLAQWKDGSTSPAITDYTYTDASGQPVTAPTAAGAYDVTFTVPASTSWAATPIDAGKLVIAKATPTIANFTVDTAKLAQTAGSVVEVPITPKDSTLGAITVRYNGQPKSATNPSGLGAGSWPVDFDVADTGATGNWNGANSIFAGILVISGVPQGLEVTWISFDNGTNKIPYKEAGPYPLTQFDGNPVIPAIGVQYGVTSLELDRDYKVEFFNNQQVSQDSDGLRARVVVTPLATTPIPGVQDLPPKTAYFLIGKQATNTFICEWTDAHGILINHAQTVPMTEGATLVIAPSAAATGYSVVEWRLSGVKIPAGQLSTDGNSYTFTANRVGQHTVTLIVKDSEGNVFSSYITIVVNPKQ